MYECSYVENPNNIDDRGEWEYSKGRENQNANYYHGLESNFLVTGSGGTFSPTSNQLPTTADTDSNWLYYNPQEHNILPYHNNLATSIQSNMKSSTKPINVDDMHFLNFLTASDDSSQYLKRNPINYYDYNPYSKPTPLRATPLSPNTLSSNNYQNTFEDWPVKFTGKFNPNPQDVLQQLLAILSVDSMANKPAVVAKASALLQPLLDAVSKSPDSAIVSKMKDTPLDAYDSSHAAESMMNYNFPQYNLNSNFILNSDRYGLSSGYNTYNGQVPINQQILSNKLEKNPCQTIAVPQNTYSFVNNANTLRNMNYDNIINTVPNIQNLPLGYENLYSVYPQYFPENYSYRPMPIYNEKFIQKSESNLKQILNNLDNTKANLYHSALNNQPHGSNTVYKNPSAQETNKFHDSAPISENYPNYMTVNTHSPNIVTYDHIRENIKPFKLINTHATKNDEMSYYYNPKSPTPMGNQLFTQKTEINPEATPSNIQPGDLKPFISMHEQTEMQYNPSVATQKKSHALGANANYEISSPQILSVNSYNFLTNSSQLHKPLNKHEIKYPQTHYPNIPKNFEYLAQRIPETRHNNVPLTDSLINKPYVTEPEANVNYEFGNSQSLNTKSFNPLSPQTLNSLNEYRIQYPAIKYHTNSNNPVDNKDYTQQTKSYANNEILTGIIGSKPYITTESANENHELSNRQNPTVDLYNPLTGSLQLHTPLNAHWVQYSKTHPDIANSPTDFEHFARAPESYPNYVLAQSTVSDEPNFKIQEAKGNHLLINPQGLNTNLYYPLSDNPEAFKLSNKYGIMYPNIQYQNNHNYISTTGAINNKPFVSMPDGNPNYLISSLQSTHSHKPLTDGSNLFEYINRQGNKNHITEYQIIPNIKTDNEELSQIPEIYPNYLQNRNTDTTIPNNIFKQEMLHDDHFNSNRISPFYHLQTRKTLKHYPIYKDTNIHLNSSKNNLNSYNSNYQQNAVEDFFFNTNYVSDMSTPQSFELHTPKENIPDVVSITPQSLNRSFTLSGNTLNAQPNEGKETIESNTSYGNEKVIFSKLTTDNIQSYNTAINSDRPSEKYGISDEFVQIQNELTTVSNYMVDTSPYPNVETIDIKSNNLTLITDKSSVEVTTPVLINMLITPQEPVLIISNQSAENLQGILQTVDHRYGENNTKASLTNNKEHQYLIISNPNMNTGEVKLNNLEIVTDHNVTYTTISIKNSHLISILKKLNKIFNYEHTDNIVQKIDMHIPENKHYDYINNNILPDKSKRIISGHLSYTSENFPSYEQVSMQFPGTVNLQNFAAGDNSVINSNVETLNYEEPQTSAIHPTSLNEFRTPYENAQFIEHNPETMNYHFQHSPQPNSAEFQYTFNHNTEYPLESIPNPYILNKYQTPDNQPITNDMLLPYTPSMLNEFSNPDFEMSPDINTLNDYPSPSTDKIYPKRNIRRNIKDQYEAPKATADEPNPIPDTHTSYARTASATDTPLIPNVLSKIIQIPDNTSLNFIKNIVSKIIPTPSTMEQH